MDRVFLRPKCARGDKEENGWETKDGMGSSDGTSHILSPRDPFPDMCNKDEHRMVN